MMSRFTLFPVVLGVCSLSLSHSGINPYVRPELLKSPIALALSKPVDSQKIKLRYANAPIYSELKDVDIKSALLERVDQRTRLGGYTVVQVILTNIENYTCDTEKMELKTPDDFAVLITMVELFDKKGPDKTYINSALYKPSEPGSAQLGSVEFKKFNIGLKTLTAPKDNVYFKTDVTKGTFKFVRDGDGWRLLVKYEDKNLAVDGDVKLTRCNILSLEEPKK